MGTLGVTDIQGGLYMCTISLHEYLEHKLLSKIDQFIAKNHYCVLKASDSVDHRPPRWR